MILLAANQSVDPSFTERSCMSQDAFAINSVISYCVFVPWYSPSLGKPGGEFFYIIFGYIREKKEGMSACIMFSAIFCVFW